MLETTKIYNFAKDYINKKIPGLESKIKLKTYSNESKNNVFFSASIYYESVVLLQIFQVSKKTRLVFKKDAEKYLIDRFQVYKMKTYSDSVCFDIETEEELKYIGEIFIDFIDKFSDKYIGCCSSYKECSEQEHCVNTAPDIYMSCYYRQNLKNGKNFYK